MTDTVSSRRRPGFGSAFDSLRGNRGFQLLWLSNVFFFGGVWTQTLVLGWMAYELTHSEFLVAVFTAVRLAPLLLGPVAGAFADRHDKVRLLLVMSGWVSVSVAVIALLASIDVLGYGGLVLGGLAIGLGQSPSQPARASLVMELVGAGNISNANALNSLAMNMTQVIGPAIGGGMIAAIGAPAALWVSTAWYAISFLLLLPLRKLPHRAVASGHGAVLPMVISGFREIARNRLAIAVLLVTLAANVFIWPIYQSFMPVFADQRLGLDADGLGGMLTCAGVGGLIGSLLIAALGDFRGKGALFVFGTMTWAGLWALFAVVSDVPLAFVALGLIGLSSATFGVLQTTLLLLTTPSSVHGRALGLQELAIGIMPMATLGLGALAELVGVATTTLVASVALIASLVAIVLGAPAVLRIGRAPDGTVR